MGWLSLLMGLLKLYFDWRPKAKETDDGKVALALLEAYGRTSTNGIRLRDAVLSGELLIDPATDPHNRDNRPSP